MTNSPHTLKFHSAFAIAPIFILKKSKRTDVFLAACASRQGFKNTEVPVSIGQFEA